MEYTVFIVVVLGFLAIAVIKGLLDERKRKREFYNNLKENYGQLPKRHDPAERVRSIPRYFEKHTGENSIDDITWNDLSMDEIFHKMNYAYSAAGEEYLYHLLRSPVLNKEDLKKREALILYFMDHEEDRIRWQFTLAELGKTGKYSIYDYLNFLGELKVKSNGKHYIAIAGIFLSVGIMFFSSYTGVVVLIAILCLNIMSYFKEKKDIDPYLTSFAYIFRLLNCSEKLEKHKVSILEEEFQELSECRSRFKKFRRGSFLVMSSSSGMPGAGNPLELLLDYLRMMLHLDIIQFYRMLAEVRNNVEVIDRMITIIGMIESMIAIGAYRISLHDNYCIPVFHEKKALSLYNIYHPLLDSPVRNSLDTVNSVLITGSNASGKSTFLKTVAINALFAQTIHTCLGERYEGALFRIYSSMSLKDNLTGGDSYYMVEIKSLKRILTVQKKDKNPVLCFVDEVLRGTNTVERIAASTQILRSLNTKTGLCFAATHDIELTYLLEQKYDNYHFEEEFIEGDINFQYKILSGRATTRNAIKLLQAMGYDERLIEDAETLAGHFMKYGNWGTAE